MTFLSLYFSISSLFSGQGNELQLLFVFFVVICFILQGCRQGGGLKPPQIWLNSCYFTAKERWKTTEKKQLSGYKHAVLHTKNEAQKCPNIPILLSLRATNSLATLHIDRLSVLFLSTCSIIHQFNQTCWAVVHRQMASGGPVEAKPPPPLLRSCLHPCINNDVR